MRQASYSNLLLVVSNCTHTSGLFLKRVDERIEQIKGRRVGLCVVHLPMRWMPTTFSSGPWQITLYFVMGFSPGPPCAQTETENGRKNKTVSASSVR